MLNHVRCPACLSPLEDGDGVARCEGGHTYPVIGGVPDLLLDRRRAAVVSDTFSSQWAGYRFGRDKTWNRTMDARVDGLLTHLQIGLDDMVGKTLLDAGCGNGELTNEIAVRSSADVYGTDISSSVFRAQQAFPAVTFFRSNLMEPTIAPASFDFVYCGGVLHHTPNTRRALETLAPAVKPEGRIYVWLYWHVPGWLSASKQVVRRVTCRLPSAMQQPVVDILAFPPYLLHRDRAWRDHRLVHHDFYTPRYRWEHSPDEVGSWFSALGFGRVDLISESRDGFGMLAYL